MFTYKLYKKSILFGFLILCLWSCDNRINKQKSVGIQKTDSITFWTKAGRNNALSFSERQNYLAKANIAAQQIDNDSLKTKYFSRLSLAYLRLNDSLLFRCTNSTAMEMAQKTKDSIAHAEAHWDLAEFLRSNATKDSSYYHFFEAQKIYTLMNDDFSSARMLYNMAVVQEDVKDYTGAEINLVNAIELFKPLDQYRRLYFCYNALGNIANGLQDYDRALEYHQQALEYISKTKLKSKLEPVTQNNIGRVYQEYNNHEEAISYFNKVLEHDSLRYFNTRLYAKTLNNLGISILNIDNNSRKLPRVFQEAIQIQDSIGDLNELSRSNLSLSNYFIAKKDSSSATVNLTKAKQQAKLSSNYNQLLKILETLTSVDPDNAATYVQQYIRLNDSLQLADRQIRNKFARIRFETDEFIEQNEHLEDQKQLWVAITSMLLLLATSILVVIYQQVKNQRFKYYQKEQKNNEKIFNLLLSQKGKFEEGKQLEQKRISEDLHDGVLGQMLGIRLMLAGLNNKTTENAINQRKKLIKKLQSIEDDVRTISHELNHASYEKFHNFIVSIEDLLKSTCISGKMKYKFDYDHNVDWDFLDGNTKINIYRIVQECLQNSIKHAKASMININFSANEEQFNVIIADNGKGFTVKNAKKGIGLMNIESRIKKVNGSFSINSSISKGTQVILMIPFNYIESKEEEPQFVVLQN